MTTNPADRLAELLHQELRSVGDAAKDSGATTEEITADLTERLKRIRRLNREGWQQQSDSPDRK